MLKKILLEKAPDIIFGAVSVFVGIIFSYYFYKKSIRQKKLSYSIASNSVLNKMKKIDNSKKSQKIKIIYKGAEVVNVSTSNVLIWNNGAQALTKNDIETINHLKISGVRNLLSASILFSSNKSNQFNIIKSEYSDITIDFDYLNEGEGAVIQLVYMDEATPYITVNGDIKGIKHGPNEVSKLRISFIGFTNFNFYGLLRNFKCKLNECDITTTINID